MKKIAFFDTKPYDRESFDRLNNGRYEIKYFETRCCGVSKMGILRASKTGRLASPWTPANIGFEP